MLEVLALLAGFLKLGSLVLGEIFEAKKRAREANEKYEVDREKFLAISQRALDKMRTDAVEEAKQAQDVEEQVDKKLQSDPTKK